MNTNPYIMQISYSKALIASIILNIVLGLTVCALLFIPNVTAKKASDPKMTKKLPKTNNKKIKEIAVQTPPKKALAPSQPKKEIKPYNANREIFGIEENSEIRFIRLIHGGYNWDDGMGKTGADKNFMKEFQKVSTLKKVRKYGESHPISHLALYPEDGFPPFVFLTGDGPLRDISLSDIKALRDYCMRGGMLIVDAGSASFDRSFRDLMKKVFPGQKLLDVPDDDILYNTPFNFPNGAPQFWSHGGRRGLGIKHKYRWLVYYHPGDMNDAWKSKNYADIKPEMKRNAFNLGINLVFYAFNQRVEMLNKKQYTLDKTLDSKAKPQKKESRIEKELKASVVGPDSFEFEDDEDF